MPDWLVDLLLKIFVIPALEILIWIDKRCEKRKAKK